MRFYLFGGARRIVRVVRYTFVMRETKIEKRNAPRKRTTKYV